MARILLYAQRLVVFHQRGKDCSALTRGNLIHHLHNGDLTTASGQIFGGLASHHTASNDGHASIDLLFACQHGPSVGHIRAVLTRDGRCKAGRPHSYDHSVRLRVQNVLRRHFHPKAQCDSRFAYSMRQVQYGAAHFFLAGRYAGNV